MKITKSSEQKAREDFCKFCPECEREFSSGERICKPKRIFFYIVKNVYTCQCGCEWEVEEENLKVSVDVTVMIISTIVTVLCVALFKYSIEIHDIFIGLPALIVGFISGVLDLFLYDGLFFQNLDCNKRKEIQK